LVARTAFATTWFVPSGQCPTIQSGLDAASTGDTVRIASGSYYEHDLTITSPIAIVGDADDPGSVTVDAQSIGRVFVCENLAGTTHVIGVTMMHGTASGDGFPEGCGGGMLCVDSEAIVSDCRFESNVAASGGGLCFYGGTPASVERCSFELNIAVSNSTGGGALAFIYGRSASVEDCCFSGNQTSGDGGGLAWRWGGLQGGSLSVARCTFDGNRADRFGGGAEVRGTTSVPKPPVAFSDCLFSGNWTSIPYSQGGALLFSYCAPELTDCIFIDNDSDRGGAVHLEMCETQFTRCTLSGNSAAEAGGVHCWLNSEVEFTNCIVAFSPLGQAIICSNGASASLSCCDVFGNAGGDWVGSISDQYGVNHNFAEDPLFCDSPSDDVSLAGDSPCTAEHSPCGQLIGALSVGCYPASVEEPKVISWGCLKSLYRQ